LTRGEQVGQIGRREPARVRSEAGEPRRSPEHGGGTLTRRAQLTNAGVAARLAELLAAGLPDERMVEKHRGPGAAEHPAKPDLPSGRVDQVLTADDEIDLVPQIIHHDGELVGP